MWSAHFTEDFHSEITLNKGLENVLIDPGKAGRAVIYIIHSRIQMPSTQAMFCTLHRCNYVIRYPGNM